MASSHEHPNRLNRVALADLNGKGSQAVESESEMSSTTSCASLFKMDHARKASRHSGPCAGAAQRGRLLTLIDAQETISAPEQPILAPDEAFHLSWTDDGECL